jgi:hypothetical protein
MSDPESTAAARELNCARWGDRVLRRAAAVVLERADLSPVAAAELEQITEEEAPGHE